MAEQIKRSEVWFVNGQNLTVHEQKVMAKRCPYYALRDKPHYPVCRLETDGRFHMDEKETCTVEDLIDDRE